MALTKGEKIIAADIVGDDFMLKSGSIQQDVNFDLQVRHDDEGTYREDFSKFQMTAGNTVLDNRIGNNEEYGTSKINLSKGTVDIVAGAYDSDNTYQSELELLSSDGFKIHNIAPDYISNFEVNKNKISYNMNADLGDDSQGFNVGRKSDGQIGMEYKLSNNNGENSLFEVSLNEAKLECTGSHYSNECDTTASIYLNQSSGVVIHGDKYLGSGEYSSGELKIEGDSLTFNGRDLLASSGEGAIVEHKDYTTELRQYYSTNNTEASIAAMAQQDWGYDYVINGKHFRMRIYGRFYATDRVGRKAGYRLPFTVKYAIASSRKINGMFVGVDTSIHGMTELKNTDIIYVNCTRAKDISYTRLSNTNDGFFMNDSDKFIIDLEGTIV